MKYKYGKKVTMQEARELAGFTLNDMANVFGYSVKDWENDKYVPKIGKVLLLCNVYGINLWDLEMPESWKKDVRRWERINANRKE